MFPRLSKAMDNPLSFSNNMYDKCQFIFLILLKEQNDSRQQKWKEHVECQVMKDYQNTLKYKGSGRK